MKKKNKVSEVEAVARISRLPDELIHRILSFLDLRFVVQTSLLSKRWKFIWTTLPFLKINWYDQSSHRNGCFYKFLHHVFTRRNHNSNVLKLDLHCQWDLGHSPAPIYLYFSIKKFDEPLISIEKFVKYAISHNVEELDVACKFCEFSIFNSDSIKKLKLAMDFESSRVWELECWELPALTTLYLKSHNDSRSCKLPESCLICLSGLTTLCLENCDIPESSFMFSLPALTTLRLVRSNFPHSPCDFPALSSLELIDVVFPKDRSNKFLSSLVSLQSLTLYIREKYMKDCYISHPQLINLKIGACMGTNYIDTKEIVVNAPNLRNYQSLGMFPIKFEVYGLENVNVNVHLWENRLFKRWSSDEKLIEYFKLLVMLFDGLGTARIITLDMDSIEALCEISEFVGRFRSPLHNLEYVKLPRGYKISSIPSAVRRYLLGGSPKATIVTTLPQDNVNRQTALPDQNAEQDKPLVTPSKELVKSHDIRKKVCVDTVDMRVQEEYGAGNLPDAPVAGKDNNQASSSRVGNDIGLWQGHEVDSEFVGLLNQIVKKYPDTFEHFTTKSKLFCTMELNMLCTTVNAFTKTSMTEVDTKMITEYRSLLSDLKRSFNLNWLVSRLNYIEQLRFSNPLLHELYAIDSRIDDSKSKIQDLQTRIDDAKIKLQDLEAFRIEKITEIEKAFGTMGVGLAANAGYIGDDLLSDP